MSNGDVPNLEAVYSAVAALYDAQGGAAVAQTSDFLDQVQKSVYAWTIADRMLAEKRSSGAAYFAASTMHKKLELCFRELPPESFASLRVTLLSHLSSFKLNPADKINSSTLTQLCLALVDFYLQVNDWNDFVGEIFTRFSVSENDQKIPIMLTLLQLIPEELSSGRNLRLGDNRRRQVNGELAGHTSTLLKILDELCLKHTNSLEMWKRVLSCLASWLLNPLVPTDELASSPLLRRLFEILMAPGCPSDLHNAASECLSSALYRIEDTQSHQSLALCLQTGVFALVPSFEAAVAGEDLDRLHNYAKVFMEMSDSFVECIVSTPGKGFGNLQTLELLLLVAGYHDYSLIEMTFNVWYRLSEMLFQRNDDELNGIICPFVERYVIALHRHCRFDADLEGIPDEKDDFVDFRIKVTESVKDVVFVIGTDRCLKTMFEIMRATSKSWEEAESALFIITALAHNILPSEEEIVPQLIGAVLSLPAQSSHPALVQTSIRLLSALNEWIEVNPSFHDATMQWLLSVFAVGGLAPTAADAIEGIISRSPRCFQSFFQPLLAMMQTLDASIIRHSEGSINSLLRTLTLLIVDLSDDEAISRLTQLCAPQADGLNKLLSKRQNNTSNKENIRSGDATIWLDRLAAIFRQLKPNAAWLPLAQELWPILSACCNVFQSHSRVVEYCCRTIRFVIRSLGTNSFPLIEPLVRQMVDIYTRHHHSSFLYLGSVLVDEYAVIPQLVPGLLYMLKSMSEISFVILGAENGMRDHPDTVDDLFRLCIRFVQKTPAAFFQADFTGSVFECGMVALKLDHQEANRSVTKFFSETIESRIEARKMNVSNEGVLAVETILSRYGSGLVSQALYAALFHVRGGLVRDMAELIYAIGRLSKEQQNEWLRIAVENVAGEVGQPMATREQLINFHETVIQAKDLKTVTAAVRQLIRLYQ